MTSQQTSSSRTKPILHILSHLYLNLFCSTNSNLSCSSSSYRHNLQKKFHKQQKQEQHKKQKQCFSRITFVWNTRVEKESGGLARQTKPLFSIHAHVGEFSSPLLSLSFLEIPQPSHSLPKRDIEINMKQTVVYKNTQGRAKIR